jgi:hypothetical protein
MATQSPGRGNAESDRITFEVQSLNVHDGQVLVTGRWYGVRGRRFMRPTLILSLRADGSERRALADLEHKPWAAEDGESWTAAFPLDISLAEAEEIELSVAPDITVALHAGAGGKTKAVKGGARAPGSRAPRVRSDRVPARPSRIDRSQEMDRLATRLQAAERAHERERERREEAERTLESERNEALALRSEVGRLRAELDLVGAARQELNEAARELESARAQARSASAQLERSRAEARDLERQLRDALDHGRDTQRALKAAQANVDKGETRLDEARLQLQTTEQELAAATESLQGERAEAQRLRQELQDAELAVRRLAQENPAAPLRSATVGPAMPRSGGPAGAVPHRATDLGVDPEQSADGNEPPPRFPRLESAEPQRLESMSPRLRALNKLETSTPPWVDRPLNPALRPTDSWLVRGLAIVVVLAAVVAVILIVSGTL